MSNIQDGLRAIFVHNPKAAGTSIAIALGLEHGHDTMEEARARHGEKWDAYFRFAFVREPLSRLISTYEFAQMDRSWYHDNLQPGPYGQHGDAHVDHRTVKGKSLDDCLRMLLDDPTSLKQPGWLPQSHFVSDPALLDFVGRFENLAADWSKVCQKLRIDTPLPKINPTKQQRDRNGYATPFACEAASRLYRQDFVTFGYKLPIPSLPPEPKPLTAGQVTHGAAGIAKAVTGTGGADEALIASRTAICEACPNWVKLVGMGKCKLCGCLTWAKVRNAAERCPDSPPRW